MLSTSNIAIQFGAKPLFEQVTVKFSDGNRYGLIGANGCGKSTLMKILSGELDQSTGDVMLQAGLRLGKLNQNQFAYEDERVLDVVMQGHLEMWHAMKERDRIYADSEASDEDYMRAAELEGKFAECGGYTAEARAGSILSDAGLPEALHNGLMRSVPPGLKLRVLLAQALFSRPDVLLLDEPTNNLDINSIRWLEGVLNNYDATMIIISHDRHFLNQVCTHIADLDFRQLKIYPGNYDDFMLASVQARQRVEASNAKAQDRISDLQEFVRRFSANASKARQATSRRKQLHSLRASQEVVPLGGVRGEAELYVSGREARGPAQHYFQCRSRRTHRHHRPERHRQEHADAVPRRGSVTLLRSNRVGRECPARLYAAGPAGRVRR
jgi:ATPase subunit of ABC transporter with duplicated ATPase domains